MNATSTLRALPPLSRRASLDTLEPLRIALRAWRLQRARAALLTRAAAIEAHSPSRAADLRAAAGEPP